MADKENSMRDVYCGNCIHMETRSGDIGGDVGYFCKTYHYEHKTSIGLSFPMKQCRDVNGNNDCKGYREKTKWWKIWRSK